MAKALVNNSSPQKNRHARRASTPTLKNIGRTLAQELGEIIDELGEDHPDLVSTILQYIKQVNQQHPDWGPVMEQARKRLIGGKLGGHIHRRTR